MTFPFVHPGSARAEGNALRPLPGAAQAVREVPGLAVVTLPPALAVGADYGLTILAAAPPGRAERRISFILSPAGQAILARHSLAGPESD